MMRRLEAGLSGEVTRARLLALARDVAGLDPAAPRIEPAAGLRARWAGAAGSSIGAFAAVLLIDICAYGPGEGLARAAAALRERPDRAEALVSLGGFLDAARLARDLTAAELQDIWAQLAVRPDDIPGHLAALAFLGLSKGAPLAARTRAFEDLAAPLMRDAAARGAVDLALAIEGLAYEGYIKTVETPEHHRQAFAQVEAAFSELSEAPWSGPPPARTDRPKVAFLMPNGHLLAHADVLLGFLEGLARLPDPPIEPLVIIYADPSGGPLGQKLDALGVRRLCVPPTGPYSAEDRFGHVRKMVAAEGAAAVVVVSVPTHLAYFGRRPLGPVQIWWSLKFPLPNFPELDGRVFYRSLTDKTVEVQGRTWRGGPLALPVPEPPAAEQVAAIRAQFAGKLLLGTIAREEKIANPEFLAAVAEVLRRHPEACFLWTGRTEPAEVREAFAAAGVAEQCHFVGWVDPAPYIMAFDVFLETYPLTGLMCGWAMAFGRPLVSVGPMGILGAYLGPVLRGEDGATAAEAARIEAIFAPVRGRLPGLWAETPADIPAFVQPLLADPALRDAFGAAQRRYVEAFMTDPAQSAAIQARHFAEIVREAAAARGG